MTHWAVTGATGFVGSALLKRLTLQQAGQFCGADCSVRAITRHAPATAVADVTYAQVRDFSEAADWPTVLAGVQVLVHTAARVHVMADTAADPLAEFRRVNVDGTLKLARHAAAAGVQRFVFISSIGVNGVKTSVGQTFTEANGALPHNDYALSKWEAEQGLWMLSADTGMEVVIIRPPLVYGPQAPGNFGTLMRAVQRGLPLPLALVRNQRSLVALDNLVNFIITCATHPMAANQTFLVSDGQDLSTPKLIRKMAEAAGVPARLLPVPVWALQAGARLLGKGDAVQRLCGNLQVDISKARELLGWVPPVSVEDGLRACFVTPGLTGNQWRG